MVSNLLISVIIPCYNAAEFIWECLESVQRQQYSQLQVIVVNDGSTDHTGQLLKKWNRNESLQMQIIETENQGASAARNTGLREAQGEYIQFLDADDLLLPKKISHQVSMLKNSREKFSIVAGSYKYVNNKGNIINTFHPDERSPWIGLMHSNLGLTSSNLFQRKALERINGFNESLASSQDTDLLFRLLKDNDCKVIFDDKLNTLVRRINPNSISTTNEEKNLVRFIELRQRVCQYLEDSDQLTDELIQEYRQAIFSAVKRLYDYNPQKSMEMYHTLLPPDFVPKQTQAISPSYQATFKLLGFRGVQIAYKAKKMLTKKEN